jgi:STE24 endopeptidase
MSERIATCIAYSRTVLGGRLRVTLALLATVVVGEAAVLLLLPRSGVIDPATVDAASYFSAAQIHRARAFGGPQLLILVATLVVQGGLLLAVAHRVRSTGRPLPGAGLRARRPVVASGVAAAALSVAVAAAALPLVALGRQRSLNVGLATQSWPGWAGDVLKGWAIGAVSGALLAMAAVALMRRYPRGWWLPGSVAVVLVGAAVTYAGPVVLDPLFNHFTPVPRGELRADVLALARRAHVDVGQVLLVDASRRTTAANAYVAGLGATKRVVLYDNLVRDFDRDERRLVVAHELGHVHDRDVPRGLLWLALVAPTGLFAVGVVGRRLAPGSATGAWRPGAEAVPALAAGLAVVSFALTTVSNQLSRRVEARADSFALELTRQPRPFISFERRIALQNVSDPDPPGWVSFLLSTHPSAVERIGAGEAVSRSSGAAGPSRRRTPAGS